MERLVLMHQLMMISAAAASPAALIVTPLSKPKVVSIAAATTRMGQDAMAEDDPEAVVSMAEADLSFSMAEADPSLEAEDDLLLDSEARRCTLLASAEGGVVASYGGGGWGGNGDSSGCSNAAAACGMCRLTPGSD